MIEYKCSDEDSGGIKYISVESDLDKVIYKATLDFDEKLREAYMAGYRKAREEIKAEGMSKW